MITTRQPRPMTASGARATLRCALRLPLAADWGSATCMRAAGPRRGEDVASAPSLSRKPSPERVETHRAFLFDARTRTDDVKEASDMVYSEALTPPQGRESLNVLRRGREGVWWERGDGLRVAVAAPERDTTVDRRRLSLVAMVIAYALAERSPR